MKSKFISVEALPEVAVHLSFLRDTGSEMEFNYDIREIIKKLSPTIRRKLKYEKEKKIFSCCGPIYVEESNYICSKCGKFEQYFPNNKKKESKDYMTTSHCKIWLNRLQGKDPITNKELLEFLVQKAKNKCTINNSFSVSFIDKVECSDIRNWLKLKKKSKFNIHVPSLHRAVTRELGYEIIPPQFNSEEELQIIKYWDKLSGPYCQIYNELKQNNGLNFNNPSYGHLLVRIVEYIFTDDIRAEKLRAYVHRNSTITMELRDKAWDIVKQQFLV